MRSDFFESFMMAIHTLRANKLRSWLTILGVAIGVITVIFMVSIIQGLDRAFAEQIEALGSNTIFVSKLDPGFGRQPSAEERQRKELTLEDADAVRREAPAVADVAPIHRLISGSVRYEDKQSDTPVLSGVTPSYEFTLSSYVDRGRFINDIDLAQRENVCLLGVDVLHKLFPYEEPLGQSIKINGRPFRIIGVMASLGSFFGQSRDNVV
ncbi:MAG: ABC transporter permease, partial [Pyrinomonadaceae bacterium]